MSGAPVEQLWQGRQVLVCVGTGGVGKTTVAASLAMAAAICGRRVLVMTIDPSLRLAQSLGLDGRRGEVVPVQSFAGGGSVSALVLDVQRTFDELIEARARSPEQAAAIRSNPIYRHFSASLAGSHEYAAIEKLWDGVQSDAFDLVVLDTPPAQNALDFLEAPRRILQFLQGQSFFERVPGGSLAARWGKRLFDLGGGLVKNNVAKIAGAQVLDDVLAFLRALTDMYDSFCERAEGVERLLCGNDCAFVLVAGTGAAQAAAVARFKADLRRFDISPRGHVLNRLRRLPTTPALASAPVAEVLDALRQASARPGDDETVPEAFLRACQAALLEGAEDARAVAELHESAPGVPVFTLYERGDAVDRPQAIETMARELLRAPSRAASR